jgi:hypothetical protein
LRQRYVSRSLPISKIDRSAVNYRRPRLGVWAVGLADVFSPDGELFRRFNTHFDASAGAAQQRDLDRTIGEQLRHGHVRVGAIRRLYDDRFIGTAAEY